MAMAQRIVAKADKRSGRVKSVRVQRAAERVLDKLEAKQGASGRIETKNLSLWKTPGQGKKSA